MALTDPPHAPSPWLSLVDLLYGLAIGLGLERFPANPLREPLTTVVFLFTLLVASHDWYMTHRHYPVPAKERGH